MVMIRLAVIGLGKFGGREIGYGSDLDIILCFLPTSCHPGQESSLRFR